MQGPRERSGSRSAERSRSRTLSADSSSVPLPNVADPEDLPALYKATDAYSLAAQRRFVRSLAIRLIALLLAAIAGAVGSIQQGLNAPGAIAFVAFLIALAFGTYLGAARPDRAWYEGRAAAESVKTLAWRFMVRGQTYPSGEPANPEQALVSDLAEILTDLNDVEVDVSADASQVTAVMRQVRALSFEERRSVYRGSRLEVQRKWYADKAQRNRAAARVWFVLTLTAEFIGVIAGALMAFGVVNLDVLGIVAAVAASGTAWTQAKQHGNLATAYAVTALEISNVIAELDALESETIWPEFVGDAEESISREHTLWRASRGLRIRPRRRR